MAETKARTSYLAALYAWHEADPDHCGGECFRDEVVDAALGIKSKPARPAHPATMIGRKVT